MLETLAHEIRLAGRRLVRDPFRSGISIVALTLGIGLTTSMFSIGYSILFRGTPFDGEDTIYRVERLTPSGSTASSFAYLDYRDIAETQTAFSDIAAFGGGSVDLADDESRPERIQATRFTPEMLPLLQVSPALGRGFGPDDTGPDARVVLMSDRLWRSRYGGDPSLLGRPVRLNGESYTVIGIMAAGFHFPGNQDLWLPMPYDRASVTGRDEAYVQVIGRLVRGADERTAQAELDAIYRRLSMEYRVGEPPTGIALIPLVQSFLGEDDAQMLWAMMIGSLFVLAIACVNVMNLLTAVAADRTGDLAISSVLGASRARLLSQLLLDAVALALTGGALGIVVANLGVDWFDRALVGRKPIWLTMEVDTPVLLFAVGVSLLAALLAGLTPAIRSARISVREIIQDESRGASSRGLGRLSQAMVVVTMALAYPLLVAAGLLIASFSSWNEDLPFDRQNMLVAQVGLAPRYFPTPESRLQLIDGFVEWAEAQPGITAAAFSDIVPGLGSGNGRIELEGRQYSRDEDYPRARLAVVRPGYFETIGVSANLGRAFDDRDRTGPPAVLANQPFVARHFPNDDPVGKRVRVHGDDEPWRTIVGVVPDLRMQGTGQGAPDGLYLMVPPVDPLFGYFLVRVDGDITAAATTIREGFAELAPDVPIQALETLDNRIERAFWIIHVVGPIFTTFGLVALFLASVGLFGVVAHSVTRRTREIGVRMAVGATGGTVLATIARGGITQAMLGALIGSGFAIVGSRLLAGALFGVRPGDPVTMLVVGGVLLGSAFLATLLPALRAARLSPVEALRG